MNRLPQLSEGEWDSKPLVSLGDSYLLCNNFCRKRFLIGLLVGSWEVLKLQPAFQTKSENYGYSGGDLTVLLIVLGDGFSPRFNLRSRS